AVLAAGAAGVSAVRALAVCGAGALLAGSRAAAKQLFKVRKHHGDSISGKDLVKDMHLGIDALVIPNETHALTAAWARASKAEFEKPGQRAPAMMGLAAPPEYKDNVECSIFAPARPERGRVILVQALLHRAEHLAVA